jgi:SsrA-binding protein
MSFRDMAKPNANFSPTIQNRRATHDYFIEAKIECGLVLMGSEVKSLRDGKATLNEAFGRIEGGELYLFQAHIDPYAKAAIVYNHEAKRTRKLLVKKRELRKLESALAEKGTTLIPLRIYFDKGYAKVEMGVGRGKKFHDKRESIRKKESDRELRRAMTRRG